MHTHPAADMSETFSRAGSAHSAAVTAARSRIVHVDVKLARDAQTDEHAVLVVVWAASRRNPPMYRVRNRCSVAVRVHQVRRTGACGCGSGWCSGSRGGRCYLKCRQSKAGCV
jgi:hypothetical protein